MEGSGLGPRMLKRRVRSWGGETGLPESLFSFGLQLLLSLALKLPNTKKPTTIAILHRALNNGSPKLSALPASCASAMCWSRIRKVWTEPSSWEERPPPHWNFIVCFFCSIDWKDYDDREPRHKGQSEVLEGLLQQVRALHQHYNCRGKDKNLRWAIDWGLGGAGNVSSFLTGSYLLIHQGERDINICTSGITLQHYLALTLQKRLPSLIPLFSFTLTLSPCKVWEKKKKKKSSSKTAAATSSLPFELSLHKIP